MKQVFANRASYILYNFLISNPTNRLYVLPANVCPCVPATFLLAKQPFCFIDIDAKTHAMDIFKCRALMNNPKIGGLLYVHAYGNEVKTNLFSQAKNHGWTVIEDCCLCEPNIFNKRLIDVDLQLYSTGYAKFIELSYGGGFGYIADDYNYIENTLDYSRQAEAIQLQHIKACLSNRLSYSLPYNFHWLNGEGLSVSTVEYITDISTKVAQMRTHKEKINAIYDDIIPQELKMGSQFKHWRYMLLIENRDVLLKRIFDAGYFAGTNYPSVATMYSNIKCNIAERDTLLLINLFNDFRISEECAERIAIIVKKYYER